ncbi:MAG TPA: PhzF family phenazine biosynthesis protein [Candidatus Saccharimonadales bacterium]|nr:PhzF family phenazine biosynthesis protein [Candidatus Saccharimonadales bacterium]
MKVHIVSAFTRTSGGGNPAGVVLDASNLTAAQMQLIAHTVGASETAFVLPSESMDYNFRYFTPTQEIALCGHATIASWVLLTQQNSGIAGIYKIKTLAGQIGIEVDNDGKVFMEQPEQAFKKLVSKAEVTEVIGVKDTEIFDNLPLQIVNNQLLVPMTSTEALNNLAPDKKSLVKTSSKHDFFGFHCFVLSKNDILAEVRNFCPRVGIYEDAATGTAAGSFLEYLRHYEALPRRDVYRISQGKAMGRPSEIYGKFKNGRCWIGGYAVVQRELSIDL